MLDKSKRFLAIDQSRAIAIILMCFAHFGQGTLDRLGSPHQLTAVIMYCSHIATPAFVVVFGITIGFVYLNKFEEDPRAASRRIWQRALRVAIYAVLLGLPQWAQVLTAKEVHIPWLFLPYSVLMFYAVALAILPLWLMLICRHPMWLAPVSGLLLWVAGAGLERAGAFGETSWQVLDFVTQIFGRSSYEYYPMFATALCAVPFGVWLREHRADPKRMARGLRVQFLLGLGAVCAGLVGGLWVYGSLARIAESLNLGEPQTPPQVWYFVHCGACVLVWIPLLCAARSIPRLAWGGAVLALFGQCSLEIYAGQECIWPIILLTDRYWRPNGLARVASGLAMLIMVVVAAILWNRRTSRNKAAARGAS